MHTVILVVTQALFVILLAELAAGIVHWFEDAYIRENTPLIGSFIGRPNVIHHHLPRHMTRNNWWQSSWDAFVASAVIVLVAWTLDCLTWQVWLFAIISTNANEFHKWAHRTRKENGRLIGFLQDIRLLQTPQHHALHHTNPKNVRYCVVTNALNPLLDRARFWAALEWLLARTLGLHRRPDTSLPDHGPAPAWLEELRRPVSPGLTLSHKGATASLSHAALLILVISSGVGCRTTDRAVQASRPHTELASHQVSQLDSVFVTADGRLVLRATGRLVGQSQATALRLVLPRLPESARTQAQRVTVPASAVQAGWGSDAPLLPVPVGPPLVFKNGNTYEWDWLRPAAGRRQEVRLVRRTGAVERWEILLVNADAATGDCRFTVFEVRPASIVAHRPATLALLPLAVAYDALDNVAAATSVGALVGLSVVGAPWGGGVFLTTIDQWEPVKRFRGR